MIIKLLLAVLRLYLKVTLFLIACKTAYLIFDDSWKDDLEERTERVVFLVTTYLFVLLWPVMLVTSLNEWDSE